ncbi:hypothetical protein WB44_07245 [Synechococcus sp. WH 8020]|nr:hypothetical protein WB44_07245 [Synechococcus sp. WH 8020]
MPANENVLLIRLLWCNLSWRHAFEREISDLWACSWCFDEAGESFLLMLVSFPQELVSMNDLMVFNGLLILLCVLTKVEGFCPIVEYLSSINP